MKPSEILAFIANEFDKECVACDPDEPAAAEVVYRLSRIADRLRAKAKLELAAEMKHIPPLWA